jgi:hypothetical protein
MCVCVCALVCFLRPAILNSEPTAGLKKTVYVYWVKLGQYNLLGLSFSQRNFSKSKNIYFKFVSEIIKEITRCLYNVICTMLFVRCCL